MPHNLLFRSDSKWFHLIFEQNGLPWSSDPFVVEDLPLSHKMLLWSRIAKIWFRVGYMLGYWWRVAGRGPKP